MQVRFASEPAPDRQENEDTAFHAGPMVGVLDGVTAPEGVNTGCRHNPAWYVRRLSAHLSEAAPAATAPSLGDSLAAAIDMVRRDHDGHCDLGNPATPAATVCLVRSTGNRFEYLILSDTTLVVEHGDDVLALTDRRFSDVVAELDRLHPVPGAPMGSPEFLSWRDAYFAHKYQLTNTAGGYWVANSVPDAAYHAMTGSFPTRGADGVRRAALLTDGVSCLVDLYRRMDWAALLDAISRHGPDAIIQQVRRTEESHGNGAGTGRRWKRQDDATAALCTFTDDPG
ncbi:hypothetical protein AB0M46_37920 [Dactylosporangium sp. NPDC051485]|uniref:hypothetical protein n=1 Tax=Dactylosporangium sp. NPDC051485 TaxID=3154846 RepID=UPI0034455118